jgi:hypothetical protein
MFKSKIAKKYVALFASVAILFTTAIPVSAATETTKSILSLHAPLPTLKSAKKLDPTLSKEIVLSDDSGNLPKHMTSQNVEILSSYGVNLKNDVTSVNKVKDVRNDRNISEVQYNNGCLVGFDDDNNIVSISNFKGNSASSLSNSTATGSNKVDLKDIINTIRTNSNLNDSYKLVDSEAFDDNYWQLDWEKDVSNGTLNPQDSLKVVLDRKDNSIVSYNRFLMIPNTTQAVISEEEALTEAQPVLDSIPNVKNKTASLSVIRPNHFWNDGGPYETENFDRLAYKISVNDDQYEIYIDAVTGENLGGDISKTEDGKAFAWSGFSYAQQSANLAYSGMSGLGYNMLSSWVGSGSGMGSAIQNYWNSSTSYAFYVDCHGSPTTLTDNSTWWLYTTNVTGNWHFVFLDACSTAVDAGWANAFKVNGYSQRAYLGWSTDVNEYPAYQFCTYFWPEAVNRNHSNNIRDAAVWAASQVPGSGSTPIKFYGDTTYNGRA